MHDSKSIFVRAATFGQLTKHIFDHGGGSHPNCKSLCQHALAWETDDDDRAKLRRLIEIFEQFDLVMVGAEDVGEKFGKNPSPNDAGLLSYQ